MIKTHLEFGGKRADASVFLTSILVFGAAIACSVFRATVTDHVTSLWTASGDAVTYAWRVFYDYFDGNIIPMGIGIIPTF